MSAVGDLLLQEHSEERWGDFSLQEVTLQGSTGKPGRYLHAPGGIWCGAAVPRRRREMHYKSLIIKYKQLPIMYLLKEQLDWIYGCSRH